MPPTRTLEPGTSELLGRRDPVPEEPHTFALTGGHPQELALAPLRVVERVQVRARMRHIRIAARRNRRCRSPPPWEPFELHAHVMVGRLAASRWRATIKSSSSRRFARTSVVTNFPSPGREGSSIDAIPRVQTHG